MSLALTLCRNQKHVIYCNLAKTNSGFSLELATIAVNEQMFIQGVKLSFI